MKATKKKVLSALAVAFACVQFAACSSSTTSTSEETSEAANTAAASADEGSAASGEMMSSEEIIKKAAGEGKVGNWGLGNEYEIQALLTKYGLPTDYITQDFTMDLLH